MVVVSSWCDTSFGSIRAEIILLILVHQADVALQGIRCLYPLGRKLGAVELTEWSLACLDDGKMLNDDIMDMFAM